MSLRLIQGGLTTPKVKENMETGIRLFRLSSGEDVICNVVGTSDPINIEIENPLQVILQPTQEGFGIGLVPFMPYCVGKIGIRWAAIVAEAGGIDAQLSTHYEQAFSPIIRPNPAGLITG